MKTTELAVPESHDVARNLPSPWLYQLEQAGSLATEVLDERARGWAHEGWTQQRMADEMGCTQAAISYRLTRLRVETASNRGRPKTNNKPLINQPIEDETIEVQPEDIIEEEEEEEHHCTHCYIHCPSGRYLKENT